MRSCHRLWIMTLTVLAAAGCDGPASDDERTPGACAATGWLERVQVSLLPASADPFPAGEYTFETVVPGEAASIELILDAPDAFGDASFQGRIISTNAWLRAKPPGGRVTVNSRTQYDGPQTARVSLSWRQLTLGTVNVDAMADAGAGGECATSTWATTEMVVASFAPEDCSGPKPCCCQSDVADWSGPRDCIDGQWQCPWGWFEECEAAQSVHCEVHEPSASGCDPLVLGRPCSPSNPCPGPLHECLTSGDTAACACPCTPDDPATPSTIEDSCPGYDFYACQSFIVDDIDRFLCARRNP